MAQLKEGSIIKKSNGDEIIATETQLNNHNTDVAAHSDIRQQINDLDANKVDNSRVLTDVPVNAKFTDTVTKPLTKSDAVYDYQKLVKGMGYNIGVYADMKTGQATGCDGLYGATMETITNQLRKKYGLAQTGIVDADLYGKIALELANKPDDSAKVASLETKVKALQAEVNAKAAIALEASNKLKSARNAIDTLKVL